MTRAELADLLAAAGITNVTMENIAHPGIVYVKVGGSAYNMARARAVVERERRLRLLHTWVERETRRRILRVELLEGDA